MLNQLLALRAQAAGITKPKNQAARTRTRRARRAGLAGGSNNSGNGSLAIQQAPVAVSQTMGSSRPSFAGSTRGGDLRIRVRHREYIQDVAGSVAYAVSQLSINPGLFTTFPWLSGLAPLFESYKFNSLSFQFKTEKGTSTTGKVFLSVDWDAADAAPTSKSQQLQERTAIDCAAWAMAQLNCDQADLLKFGVQRYIRTSAVAGTDIKTYDVGNLQVGTQGMADTSAVGELYVTYDVELITPQPNLGLVSPLSQAKIVGGGTVSKTAPYGTAPLQTGQLSVSVSNTGNGTLTFNQVGTYIVNQTVVGTGIGSSPNISGTAASTGLPSTALGALSSTQGGIAFYVNVTAVGQTLVIDWSPETTITASTTYVASWVLGL